VSLVLSGQPRFLVPLTLVAVLALTAAVYVPALGFNFVGYDDPTYVVFNARVHEGLGWSTLAWAATSFDCGNWHPLTWLSHALDWRMYGDNAGGHHATSIGLHLVAVVLVFGALRALTGSAAVGLWTAAVFAVHPLNVQSVAWIAERKNVLAGLFFAATLWAYVSYAARPRPGQYAFVTLLFALGLTAKPAIVTLPVLLLVLDVWPLGRLPRPATTPRAALSLVVEKLPWLALSALSSLVTVRAQSQALAIEPLRLSPLSARLCVAVTGYWSYLVKLLWPAHLAFFYPRPELPCSSLPVGTAAGVFVAISMVAVLVARRRPYVLVGWTWFVITLLPVIGLIQVGYQLIADRYVYVPMLGLLLATGCGASSFVATRPAARPWVAVAAAAIVLGFAGRAAAAVGAWRDSTTLYQSAIAAGPGNFFAFYDMALLLRERGDSKGALDYYLLAVQARPALDPNHEIGAMLAEAGRIDEALPHLMAAVQVKPLSPRAHYNLGLALWAKGRRTEARAAIEAAVALDPKDPRLRDFLREMDTAPVR
jgi:protein O-mannosyl-transferase